MEIFVTLKGLLSVYVAGEEKNTDGSPCHLALSAPFKNSSKNINTKTPSKPRLGIDKTLEMW